MVKSSPRNSPLRTDNTGVPTRLSPNWFFPDGDLLLRCNSILYLVHSKVLSSASGVFRDALQRPAPTPHLPSFRIPISGTDKCRTHSKSNLKMTLNQQGLSLSTRFWLRQNQRRHAMGKPVKLWGGKVSRVPKVLVVEDREHNVDYLLYFLYSRSYVEWQFLIEQDLAEGRQSRNSLITKDLLPHILSLGIRYQISTFTSSSLSLLRANATIHPFFVIRTLHPFIPPPAVTIIPAPSFTNTTTVINSIYGLAISTLLDDFPRYHENPDLRIRHDYAISVPMVVQHKCIERWNKYVSDMTTLKSGEVFSVSGTLDMKFDYVHSNLCPRHEQCEERSRQILFTQWLIWWGRETIYKGRAIPQPSQVRVFLGTVEALLEDMEAGEKGHCGDLVVRAVIKMFSKIVGPGVWEDGEEGFQGLRIDDEEYDA